MRTGAVALNSNTSRRNLIDLSLATCGSTETMLDEVVQVKAEITLDVVVDEVSNFATALW